MRALLCALFIGMFSIALVAQDKADDTGLKVGHDAPEISVDTWINTPSFQTLAELKGQVVLIKAWGIN
ncbi:MAG: hypothetical protein ACYTDT_11315 [Planctomycetota bacterium]|jgi:hypothetical protein